MELGLIEYEIYYRLKRESTLDNKNKKNKKFVVTTPYRIEYHIY